MSEPSDTPLLTAETVNKLIARLGGQLDAVERSNAPDEEKKEVRDRIVRLMSLLHSTNDQVEEVDLPGWVEVLAPRFRDVATLLQSTLNLPAEQFGGCYYRRGDSGALICVLTTADACEGVGRFDPNGCSS